ncbi:MAG: hypothetical protein M1829_003895 [Trizodia sp. TS-e1964]|nr:MAG: hypothetical protein M1829_003895 [Trizodia sp. TS-e1964]
MPLGSRGVQHLPAKPTISEHPLSDDPLAPRSLNTQGHLSANYMLTLTIQPQEALTQSLNDAWDPDTAQQGIKDTHLLLLKQILDARLADGLDSSKAWLESSPERGVMSPGTAASAAAAFRDLRDYLVAVDALFATDERYAGPKKKYSAAVQKYGTAFPNLTKFFGAIYKADGVVE